MSYPTFTIHCIHISGQKEDQEDKRRGRLEDGKEDHAVRLGVPHFRHPLLLPARYDHRNPRDGVGHKGDRGWSERRQKSPKPNR